MEEISNYLQHFGLTEKEGKLFITLSTVGQTSAVEIAQLLGYNRLQTYRIIKSLANKGLLKIVLGRPQKYSVLSIDEALIILENGIRNDYLEFEKRKKLLLDKWEKIPVFSINETLYAFRLIQGRNNVRRFTYSLIESANHELLGLIHGEVLSKEMVRGLDDILSDLQKKGVPLSIITETSEFNKKIEIYYPYYLNFNFFHWKTWGS